MSPTPYHSRGPSIKRKEASDALDDDKNNSGLVDEEKGKGITEADVKKLEACLSEVKEKVEQLKLKVMGNDDHLGILNSLTKHFHLVDELKKDIEADADEVKKKSSDEKSAEKPTSVKKAKTDEMSETDEHDAMRKRLYSGIILPSPEEPKFWKEEGAYPFYTDPELGPLPIHKAFELGIIANGLPVEGKDLEAIKETRQYKRLAQEYQKRKQEERQQEQGK